ncbi:hypothetical protein MINTM005_13050 [Mycobacterium intracellulare]|uniref:hypothetical protein n=1 Tax=Mycobacterium intracellulare TaxID=1767 RepID=UPI00192932C2|nr:hypothetical protein [Mycobacterium intracellulare]BCO56061.1 hypothetical protein MINTM005_13050 [Mycobacterium intracellulare]
MRVIEITGDTAVEYTKSMLAAREQVSAAGYDAADQNGDFGDDVWDFGNDGNGGPELRVIWGPTPQHTPDEAGEIAEMLVAALVSN